MLTLLVATATGAGLRLLRLLKLEPLLSVGERLVFGMLLGYGLLALLVLAVGLAGLLYLPAALIALHALGATGFRALISTLRQVGRPLRSAINGLRYPPNLFLATVILLVVAAALIKALAPVATQDDLMYHLALPRRYVQAHSIQFYPDSNYSLFPQVMEMLYTLGYLLGSDRLAVLLAFSTGLLAAAAAALFAKRLLQDKDGPWRTLPMLVAAIFLTAPLTGFIMRAANTDFAQASAEILAIYAFYLAVKATPVPNGRLLLLSGICGGISFSVKYYGIAIPGALGLALLASLFVRWRRGTAEQKDLVRKRALGGILTYGMPIAVLGGVWLLRNFISSGNPVWPAAGNILGGSYWSPAADPEVLLGTIPGLKWESFTSGLTYYWSRLTRPPLTLDNLEYVVTLGPLMLTALLGLPLARWKPALRLVAYAAAFVTILSFFYFSRASIRYLATVFLLCALLGAYALVSIAARARIAQTALAAVVAVTLTLHAAESLLSTGPYLSTTFALDKAAETAYLQAHMEDYPIVRYIADKTPANAVIYVWDSRPRGYRIPRPYVYGRLVPKYSGMSQNPDEWHARLKELGVTHVLLHNRGIIAPGYAPGYDPDRQTEQALGAKYYGPPLITTNTPGDDYALYELK